MMGIMVPETCWASNKICNKNSSVTSSWHFISTYYWRCMVKTTSNLLMCKLNTYAQIEHQCNILILFQLHTTIVNHVLQPWWLSSAMLCGYALIVQLLLWQGCYKSLYGHKHNLQMRLASTSQGASLLLCSKKNGIYLTESQFSGQWISSLPTPTRWVETIFCKVRLALVSSSSCDDRSTTLDFSSFTWSFSAYTVSTKLLSQQPMKSVRYKKTQKLRTAVNFKTK